MRIWGWSVSAVFKDNDTDQYQINHFFSLRRFLNKVMRVCVYECVSYLISFSRCLSLSLVFSFRCRWRWEREREGEKYRGRVYVDENNNNQLRAMTSKLAFFICLLLSYYHDDNEVTARWEYPEEKTNLCSVLSGDVWSSDQLLQKEGRRANEEEKVVFWPEQLVIRVLYLPASVFHSRVAISKATRTLNQYAFSDSVARLR